MPSKFTPPDLAISSRPLRIPRDYRSQRRWLGGDAVGSAVLNALSLTFPDGERFFIQSVKRFSRDLPSSLSDQVRAFVQQEGAHTREHIAFNDLVRSAGYDVEPLERIAAASLDIARARPPLVQLAVTVALEHFTAAFAHALLSKPELLEGAPAPLAQIWRWHSIEEIEHKGVAYDVFLEATRDLSGWRRWRLRSHVMLLTTLRFTHTVRVLSLALLRQEGIAGLRAHLALAGWLWGKPGLYRRILGDYLSFYRPDFHPWRRDDRALMRRAEAQLVAG